MSKRNILGGLVLVIALVGVGLGVASAATGEAGYPSRSRAVEFEVAEDAARFVFDESPVFAEDGMPGYGNQFVTQGYMYESGTLADGGGVNPDGSPTHPDRVIGTWICEGVLIGDGAHTETGPWVVSTQIYDFGEFDGEDTVITHGVETPDIGQSVSRAVIGGTGKHAGAVGTQSQVLRGFSESGGVELSVALTPGKS
jgi:hypothetical protein